MSKTQYVILKGRKDGISILLDAHADFELIKQNLRKKVSDAKHFFEGANANVAFKGRELSEDEEKLLLDIIINETTLDVDFVDNDEFHIQPQQRILPAPPSAPAYANGIEMLTAYYKNGLRSGQSIRYNGSVVVMGDVNPGSEIIANGNIIVLGSLKGMVHAGAHGDDRCFISALSMTPTQLRIASIITYIPPTNKESRRREKKPAIAYIQEGQVYIAPLLD